MNDMLDLIRSAPPRAAQVEELLACNADSSPYGLRLNAGEAAQLLECRSQALRSAGRVELGGGILPRLIRAFCASPYLEQDSYAETLAQLQEAFYFCKSEARERLSDGELLDLMVRLFNGPARGSAEYLAETSLDALCRRLREGCPADGDEELC